MYQIYDDWPRTAKQAYQSSLEPTNYENIDHVVFSGMGGSGTIGDLFSDILSKTDIHTSVVKGYLLPKTVDENTLVIATSISGNTFETLSALKSANTMSCKTIAFASGGKMESYCKNNGIEFRKTSQFLSPRTSLVNYVYTMLKVLQSSIPIDNTSINQSISGLNDLSKKINSANLNEDNPSLSLANWITGIPAVYYPRGLYAAAIRFKNSLNENAKCHALVEDIIEYCHNGIVAWEKNTNFQPILIQGIEDHIKTKERWEIVKEYFKSKKIDYFELMSPEGNILTKLICLIYLLDYSSIYLAVNQGIDPTPIKSIDFIKHKL